MEKVCVLMSTYNGEKFLKEQLDSLVAQEGVDISILVRDDGSKDGTKDILDTYREQGKLEWYTGENLRSARSFLHLLNHAGEAEYYAFSDQDDYWLPDKLIAATEKLEKAKGEPALYFCQTQLVDKHLNKMETPHIHPLVTFGESLVYHFVGGCTMVMNAELKKIISRYSPEFLSMHDVWIYVVAMAVGAKVFFDAEPHILYRQHGGNVVGQGFGWKTTWKRRINRIVRDKEHVRYRLAREVQKGFSDIMTAENRSLLEKFLAGHRSFIKRLSIVTDPRFHCGNRGVYRNFQASVLLNTY